MSTCHQAHNIPWNTFLEVLHKVAPRYYSAPPYPGAPNNDLQELGFTPDEEGRVSRKVKHFAKKVHSAIKEFSLTERKKYADEDMANLSHLYDKEACNEWLGEELQELSAWCGLKEDCGKCHNHYHGQYLDAVKELFIQEKAAALLHLARNGVQLERLQFVTYSNFFHYGMGRIKEDCLTLYIHLNLLLATGTLCDPSQWYQQWKRFREDEILNRYDGNAHARLYKEYFEKNPNFEDLEGLQDLLKRLFRMLYLYDMVMAERGIDMSWEDEVLSCVGSYFIDRTARNNYSNWCKQIHDQE